MPQAFGRPINGDITETKPDVEQAPDQDFIDALDNVLNLSYVEAVRWEQYTPYFNDGEPCEFRIYSACVKTSWPEFAEEGDYEDGYLDTYSLYDYRVRDENDPARYVVNGVNTQELHAELKVLAGALSSGRHYTLLKRLFGDHAQVTATREGFDVEYYDHE